MADHFGFYKETGLRRSGVIFSLFSLDFVLAIILLLWISPIVIFIALGVVLVLCVVCVFVSSLYNAWVEFEDDVERNRK